MIRAALFAFVFALSGCASGSALVTGQQRPALLPEQVRLYTTPPPSYEEVALVSAVSRVGVNAQQSLDYAVADMRRRAAALGANGLLIEYAGAPTHGNTAGVGTVVGNSVIMSGFTDDGDREVRGRAIYVPG